MYVFGSLFEIHFSHAEELGLFFDHGLEGTLQFDVGLLPDLQCFFFFLLTILLTQILILNTDLWKTILFIVMLQILSKNMRLSVWNNHILHGCQLIYMLIPTVCNDSRWTVGSSNMILVSKWSAGHTDVRIWFWFSSSLQLCFKYLWFIHCTCRWICILGVLITWPQQVGTCYCCCKTLLKHFSLYLCKLPLC